MSENTYFQFTYKAPFKGINVDVPENIMPPEYSPSFINFILKNGEIRTRPRQSFHIKAPSRFQKLNGIDSFMDANGVTHTVIVTDKGLFQLNPKWKENPKMAWNNVGAFPEQPGPNIPIATLTFLNKFYWTNGSNNLWVWDGITSVGAPALWQKNFIYQANARVVDTAGNVQVAVSPGKSGAVVPTWNASLSGNTTDGAVVWINNGVPGPSNGFTSIAVVDATNGLTAGGYFLGELNAQVLLLNTVEGTQNSYQRYPQRVRWAPSGFDNIWDPNVNIGAGFNDEIDVPDEITGFFTIGRNGFIFRTNGITELTSIGSATNPFDFNHLWASQNGIGNVEPFSISSYGPIGMFIAEDDIYNMSLSGFKRIGAVARDAIFKDLEAASGTPLAAIVPLIKRRYVYPVYKIAIPFGEGVKIWNYAIEDDSWQVDYKPYGYFTGKPNYVAIT